MYNFTLHLIQQKTKQSILTLHDNIRHAQRIELVRVEFFHADTKLLVGDVLKHTQIKSFQANIP